MPGAVPPPLEIARQEQGEVDSGAPPAAPNPHTAATRHDGVLTLLNASAEESGAAEFKAKAKQEAKRLQRLKKWRASAEKHAKVAAAKHGTDDWESFMLEVPAELLSE
eukprot:COSAG02_NODE_35680_length_465_cov_0.704918_1_plen_107_part_10